LYLPSDGTVFPHERASRSIIRACPTRHGHPRLQHLFLPPPPLRRNSARQTTRSSASDAERRCSACTRSGGVRTADTRL